MSRYLILTYAYTPAVTPRALRWGALAKRWAAQGHHVDVVSGWEAGMTQTEEWQGIHVYRANAVWLEKVRGWFKKTGAVTGVRREVAARPLGPIWMKSRLKATILLFYHHVYRSLWWPDPHFYWHSPALKQAKSLAAQTPYDVLISVSPWFTAHLVGLQLHKRFPSMCWLVDIGDPFSFLDADPENNQRLYKRLNRRVERNIFRQADVISVTTPETQDQYAILFPESASKIHVIGPLLPYREEEPSALPFFPPGNKIRLVYAGVLLKDNRRPEFLLRLFAGLLKTPCADQAELHFIGDVREVQEAFNPYQDLLGTRIFLHGKIEHARTVQAMRQASILVNIGNRTPYQLPSKVVEYASMGKPILNIIQREGDSSLAFFRPHPAVLHLQDRGDAALAPQVEQLYQFIMHPPSVDLKAVDEWLSGYRLEAVAAAYDKIVENGIKDKDSVNDC
jgi:glycosyltransferase involved in cell wall biosynthesis